jgi:dUTPase
MAGKQETLILQYKLLTDKARPLEPILLSSEVGYKLYSAYDYTILPNEKQIVRTELQVIYPAGYYGQISPLDHYGKYMENDISVTNSIYRTFIFSENIEVTLWNHGKTIFVIKSGDPVAYLVINKKYDTVLKNLINLFNI